jgi:carboxylesterase type B
VDVRDLMQIPKELAQNPADEEDEFECANLNVTMPRDVDGVGLLPVLFWIYGE